MTGTNFKWQILSGGGTLLPDTGSSTVYTASVVSVNARVIIQASLESDVTIIGSIALTIASQDLNVTLVTVFPSTSTLASGQTFDLSADVSGIGGFDSSTTWSISTGGGTLSSAQGKRVTYTAPVVSTPTLAIVRVASNANIHKYALASLTIIPGKGVPTPIEIALQFPGCVFFGGGVDCREVYSNDLQVVSDLKTSYEIASFTASILETSLVTNLVYKIDALRCGQTRECPGFVGTLDVRGLSRGQYTLKLTSTDTRGNSATVFKVIQVDRPPLLEVTTPFEYDVARPSIPINARCTDDDPTVSCSLAVAFDISGNSPLLTSGNTINTTLDLSQYEGSIKPIYIVARDSAGQTNTSGRTVFVESSPNLEKPEMVASFILDADANQIAYASGDTGFAWSTVWLRDRTSGSNVQIPLPTGQGVRPSFFWLTSFGAIFVTRPITDISAPERLYEYRNTQLTQFGLSTNFQLLRTSGDYAIWHDGTSLNLRQFSTSTNTTVDPGTNLYISELRGDIASNGLVVFAVSDGNIYSLLGQLKKITSDGASTPNIAPLTDGTNFVYTKSNGSQYAIALYNGTQETPLTSYSVLRPEPGSGYAVRNGWIAYTAAGNLGQAQVWLRSPSGQIKQVTDFASSSSIGALSPTGEVVIRNGSRLYIGSMTGSLRDVCSTQGLMIWIDNSWSLTLANTLFHVR